MLKNILGSHPLTDIVFLYKYDSLAESVVIKVEKAGKIFTKGIAFHTASANIAFI